MSASNALKISIHSQTMILIASHALITLIA